MKINIQNFQLIVLFCLFSCEDSGAITGSENVTEIENVSFSSVVTSITENGLVADGVIKNDSQTLSISPPWYIECQFYYDDNSGNTFLIGGESITINSSLSPGISLEWMLEYLTENPENYQNFIINDLRAYKH
ncbi:uncharacterized protein METZ01_LOCUS399037 [marine metagenome]|uniref:Uncharacterized protein n=1 Tax=marine metagenome TaxID=408172 RepID=A0A382VI50_9ZZZZ